MNSLTSCCIASILRRMLRMISTPARFTPRSRVNERMVSSCSRSSSEYSRVLPSVREGLSSPSRSYRRSVCGWMLYFCATALIMKYALPPLRFAIESSRLPLRKQLLPHVHRVACAELPHQLPRSLVHAFRKHETHLDDEIAPSSVLAGNATAGDAEPLAVLGPRRNAQLDGTIERRNLDARAEHRFVNGHGNHARKRVALAVKERVRVNLHRDIEIPGASA